MGDNNMKKKKQLKKEEEKRKKELRQSVEVEQSVKKTILTLIIVILIFVLFYFITNIILEKSRKLNYKEPTKEEATIQYKDILASQVFKQKDSEYYVLFYDYSGSHAEYYNEIVNDETKKIYTVDLGNFFNKNIISEETNNNVQKHEDLKVKEATLIKIKDGKNIFYYEGSLLHIKEQIK